MLEVEPPVAGPGEVVVDVARVGVCGTDVEFFNGDMVILKQGGERYPMRPGHEWRGTISSVGEGVDPGLIGRRTTGDTMLGCGVCRRCLSGMQHACEFRREIGVRGGWSGALADQLLILGPGTIGLLAAQFAAAQGVHVHLLGLPGPALEFARTLGFTGVWTQNELPDLPWTRSSTRPTRQTFRHWPSNWWSPEGGWSSTAWPAARV